MQRSFTLMELMLAIAIFAVAALVLIDQRNQSFAHSYNAIHLLRAQEIVDEVLQRYRLYPFSKEPLPIETDYHPYEVKVEVSEESINIWPEEWRLEPEFITEEEKKKTRVVLRISVDVSYPAYSAQGESMSTYHISTLVRHIELEKKDEVGARTPGTPPAKK